MIATGRPSVNVVPGDTGRVTVETVTGVPSTLTTKLDAAAAADASGSENVRVKVVPAASTNGLAIKSNDGRIVSTFEEFVTDWELKVAALFPVVS